ncbi:hypothetical protein [Capillimicrobium parvum]|uniref:Oxaloacetate decarboxylase alpha chain n=1 Tax=Capillimicrobium parvum TaxID=2884022 RepID=A0A9E6XTW4_9ACTN|nr:hypothetical protein [Capillimicrobium parvum]UGS34400.1 Oxaloacetate decarboxylase alpha chain [Capillimicrobium parvum]
MSRTIGLIDTTLRDGNQSQWGATGIDNVMVSDVLPALARAGYEAIEFITSTLMATSVRFHHEDPWERIRNAAQALPDTPLGFLTSGLRFISWDRTPLEIMEFALRLLMKNGIRRFWVIDSLNDIDAALKIASLIKSAGDAEVVMGIVYTVSPVHTDDYYAQRIDRIAASPLVDAVYLKDVGGLLTPERTRSLIPVMRSRIGTRRLEMHAHCNTGLAPLCYLEGAALGVDAVHTAISPLANGSAQPSVENTARNLRQLGYDVSVDDEALAEIAGYFHSVARRKGLPVGAPVEYDVAYYDHQVPGGMMGTLRRQLTEMGMADRLPEVLEEVAVVRQELGYPIMVTPFSQFMGAQAVMNVVSGERYSMVPNEVVAYVRGVYGEPPAPVDPDVRDRVLASAGAASGRDGAAEMTLADHRRRLGATLDDEELLMRIVMPAEQMDAIRTSPALRATSAARPIVDLIRELGTRTDVSRVQVRKGGFLLDTQRALPARGPGVEG